MTTDFFEKAFNRRSLFGWIACERFRVVKWQAATPLGRAGEQSRRLGNNHIVMTTDGEIPRTFTASSATLGMPGKFQEIPQGDYFKALLLGSNSKYCDFVGILEESAGHLLILKAEVAYFLRKRSFLPIGVRRLDTLFEQACLEIIIRAASERSVASVVIDTTPLFTQSALKVVKSREFGHEAITFSN